MPSATFNGVSLYYESLGSGDPLVLVHGSWTDHHSWDLVAPRLAERLRVVIYDRRGHSRSERPVGQGSVHEDVADLAALIGGLGLAPAHVAGNSFGACIVLRLAGQRPELFRSLVAHEPPMFDLLEGDADAAPILAEVRSRMAAVIDLLTTGDAQAGARLFVETIALGPGAWDGQLPPQAKQTFIDNAATWLDEVRDPQALTLDLPALARFSRPVLLSTGSASPPLFAPVIQRIADVLPDARRHIFDGAGHVPHLTHPDQYVDVLTAFIQAVA